MHSRWITRSLILVALLSAALLNAFDCFGQEIDKATLAERVMTAHTRYEEKLSGLSGRQDTKTSPGNNSTQRFAILGRSVININGPYQCAESETMVVEALNEDYFFELSRPKMTKEWKVAGISRELAKPPKSDRWRLILNPPLLLSTTVGNLPLREVFKDESFVLKSAIAEGKDLVVEFSAINLAMRPSFKGISGSITLSNDENLLVQSAKLRQVIALGEKQKVFDEAVIVTYDESKGMPLVVKSVSNAKLIQGVGLDTYDIQVELSYSDAKPSPEDFLLTAFDLPEPNKPEPQKTEPKDPKVNQEPPK